MKKICFLPLLVLLALGCSLQPAIAANPTDAAKKEAAAAAKKKADAKKKAAAKRKAKAKAAPAAPLPPAPAWVKDGMPPESESGFYHGGKTPATPTCTPASIERAVKDLITTYGDKYPKGKEYLERLKKIKSDDTEALQALQREALLANPLLENFSKILFVRRKGGSGLTNNWKTNSDIKKNGYDTEIAILDGLNEGKFTTVYKPPAGEFVGDVDLHFDAEKMLFSSIGKNGTWAVCEVGVDGKKFRQVSPDIGDDVDNYDPCYLPNGKIIFDSSTSYTGVPCVGGKAYVGNLHIMDDDGKNVRRLCFEQDSDWCPTVMPNGRVMYLRWEYTNSAHYFSRILMSMNPDGSDQKELYGSNSYWPNSLFYARPIPGSSTKFVGIVGSHHGTARSGPMVLFDTSLGRHETSGAVQLIPGWGKEVENKTIDNLAGSYSQHALHPFPLSDKYFLASFKVNGGWSICLLDVFDNVIVLKTPEKGVAHLEPIPLMKTPKPPAIADRVDLNSKDATVVISNLYEGPGLKDVPPGTVKNLRVYKYEYGPRRKGGHYSTGMEATWDVQYILGTVPVDPDGSASFKIPANTPLALQPLDEKGRAMQLFRSWFVGMPGENVTCIGCHESQNMAVPTRPSTALRREPSEINGSWCAPVRGFSFEREVQPVIDKYCEGCHNGEPRKDGKCIPNFSTPASAHFALHPYVRRNGPEGDYHVLTPLEFHASTSELVQMLEKGHHNVKLDDEAWERINAWIDMHAPLKGTWTEIGADPNVLARRMELRKIYANVDTNPEKIYNPYVKKEGVFVKPEKLKRDVRDVKVANWPLKATPTKKKISLDLGNKVKMELVQVPAGQFVMGSNDESPQEQPVAAVKIEKPFYIGATEVSLEQYQQFDPDYKNGAYDMHYKDQVKRGYYMDHPSFPAIRISWKKAMEFCDWLSKKTGKKVTLPTEAQWEWAARAGSDQPFYYGDCDSDFSQYANLSDANVRNMAVKGVNPKPIGNPSPEYDFKLKDKRFNDGVLHLAPVGKYKPNAWGLYDVVGNIAEWTRSDYKPYPYDAKDGRNALDEGTKKVLRGGSWHDRPFRATSSFRLGFPTWHRVYNAGFRVIVED